MKSFIKKTLLAVILLIYIGAPAQETALDTLKVKDVAELKVSETERIIDKYGGKIVDGFNYAVESVTPVAEQGFKIAVRLQLADGLAHILPLIFFFVFLSRYRKEYNRIDTILMSSEDLPGKYLSYKPVWNESNASFQLILYLIFTIVMGVLACKYTMYGITHLIAPEWFAIQDILTLIK